MSRARTLQGNIRQGELLIGGGSKIKSTKDDLYPRDHRTQQNPLPKFPHKARKHRPKWNKAGERGCTLRARQSSWTHLAGTAFMEKL